jgi:vacuolar-type H+-ATPase subunit H
MNMNDDFACKFEQVSTIYRQKFQSSIVKNQDDQYLSELREELNQWINQCTEKMEEIKNDVMNDIREHYENYCDEIDQAYADVQQMNESDDITRDEAIAFEDNPVFS